MEGRVEGDWLACEFVLAKGGRDKVEVEFDAFHVVTCGCFSPFMPWVFDLQAG